MSAIATTVHPAKPAKPAPAVRQSVFDALPDSAFIREAQLVPSPKRPSGTPPLPFSAPTLWRKVRAGTFPQPIKLSATMTCWRVSEVRAWMAAQQPTPKSALDDSNESTDELTRVASVSMTGFHVHEDGAK